MRSPTWSWGPQRVRAAGWAMAMAMAVMLAGGAGADTCPERSPGVARHASRPRFSAEVAGAVEADTAFALLRVEVPYRELAFRRSPAGHETSFDLIVHIQQGERQVAGDLWSERITVASRAALSGRAARFRKEIAFPLPGGKYTIEVRLSEPGAGMEGRLCLGLDLPARTPGEAALSSILVGACGLEGPISVLRAHPDITAEIESGGQEICAYAELYHEEVSVDSVRLHWRLIDSSGDAASAGDEAWASGAGRTLLRWQVPVADLWLDVYRLEATVTAGGQHLQGLTRLTLLSESEPGLATFLRESLEVLTYIATEEELAPLRMAEPEDRRAAWDSFWEQRDPTAEDGHNEFKEEFLRRVRHADQEYTGLRPGWRTDRGRIYIIHGAPDEVRRDPFGAGGRAVEVWFYDRLGREFVFVDRNGFGDYELRWGD